MPNVNAVLAVRWPDGDQANVAFAKVDNPEPFEARDFYDGQGWHYTVTYDSETMTFTAKKERSLVVPKVKVDKGGLN